ncbi:MAG: hypothetical protein V3V74_05480 [Nitrosomonadaceae bacterium]
MHQRIRTPVEIRQGCTLYTADLCADRQCHSIVPDDQRGSNLFEELEFLLDVAFDVLFVPIEPTIVSRPHEVFAWNTSNRTVSNVRSDLQKCLVTRVTGKVNIELVRVQGLSQHEGATDMSKSNAFTHKQDRFFAAHGLPLG